MCVGLDLIEKLSVCVGLDLTDGFDSSRIYTVSVKTVVFDSYDGLTYLCEKLSVCVVLDLTDGFDSSENIHRKCQNCRF